MGSKWLVLLGLGKFASAVTEGRGGAVFDIPSCATMTWLEIRSVFRTC